MWEQWGEASAKDDSEGELRWIVEAIYSLASRRSTILGGEPLEGVIAWFLHNSCYNQKASSAIREILRARLVSLLQHLSAPQPHRSRNSSSEAAKPEPAVLSKAASGSLSKSGGVPSCAFGKPLAKLVKSSAGKGPSEGNSLYWPFRVVVMTRALSDGGHQPIGAEVSGTPASGCGLVWRCQGLRRKIGVCVGNSGFRFSVGN